MKNQKLIVFFGMLLAFLITIIGCNKDNQPYKHETLSLQLPTQPANYSHPSLPASQLQLKLLVQSRVTDHGATLGRVLFYDPKLSRTNKTSCSSCHHQANGFADPVSLSTGFDGGKTTRNASTIVNPITSSAFFWDARENSLETMVLRPIENHVEMGLDEFDILEKKLADVGYYPQLFENAFGDKKITKERMASAMRQFLESMVSFNSEFDKGGSFGGWDFTPPANFTTQQKAGAALFFGKARCVNCHSESNSLIDILPGIGFNGDNWRDIGLDVNYQDKGVGALQPNSDGMFKVPNLKNVALTAPYMHDGRFATLEEVIGHYNENIQPSANLDWNLRDNNSAPVKLNLSPAEKSDLIAFLHTFTDHQLVTDPKFSNPFK